MKSSHNIFKYLIILLLLGGCSESTIDFGEQYKKTIYIVDSKDMLYQDDFHYDKDNFITVSVYCASSEPIKSDTKVKLKLFPKALDSLNYLFSLGNPLYVDKQLLPSSNYKLPDLNVTIKANQQYGTLNIPFYTEGLNPDTSYAFPLAIESNDKGYDINKELSIIIVNIHMVNSYSGNYTGSSIELPNKTIKSVQPHTKALSKNQIRIPIHNLSAETSDLETNFMVLTIEDSDTKSHNVKISNWKNSNVTDLGASTFDSKKMLFDLNYSFTDVDGNEYTIHENIRNTDVEIDDEDEEDA
ncbi:MAG: DUF1735 domain-containing protein [Bacteroidales bacterium]|nr:DUF1735 domain-containing protein [Bacteroidales bacterium]